MPNLNVALPETNQSILRPIVIDIIKQVQEITKINPNTNIFYPGEIQKMLTAGSDINSKQDRFAIFNTARYNFIEVEEDFNYETLGTTSIDGRGNPTVFEDEKLGVYISPLYASNNVTINFKYRCPSKTEALKWRDDIRIRISQMRDINLHDITYHYLLPAEFLVLLKIIYEKRENLLPYNQSFEEYMVSHSTDRLTLIGDLVGNDARLAISEKQCRIIGMFGFEGLPDKAERDDATGTWSISFSYKFSFDKPLGCNIRFPIMVHNQLLPPAYVGYYNKSIDLDKINKQFGNSGSALFAFESDTIMNTRVNPMPYIRIPEFDDYILKGVPHGTGSVIVALSEVDTTDKKSLLNLKELGSIVLDKDVLEFIQGIEYPYITKLYKSILHVSLYRNNEPTYTNTIDCTNNLDIKSLNELNLRNQHRIRISIVTDISLLTKEAIDRLRRYPKAFVKIIGAINELLRIHPDFNDLGNQELISNLDFNNVYAILTGMRYNNGSGESTGLYYNEGLRANEWPYLSDGSNYYEHGSSSPMNSRQAFIAGASPQNYNANTRYSSMRNFQFRDLDPRVVENYRMNNMAKNTVMVTGIIAISNNLK